MSQHACMMEEQRNYWVMESLYQQNSIKLGEKRMKVLKKQEKKGPYSLKRRLMLFIIGCWAAPIIAFFSFITLSYREGIIVKTERLIEDQLANAASFISVRLEDIITLCQSPSYEGGWEQAWKKYNNGETDRSHYLAAMNTSLKGKFYLDDRFLLYAFYEADVEWPVCCSSRAGVTQSEYVDMVGDKVKEWIEGGLDYIHLEVVDGHIFLMRNLYSTMEYKYFGTLVVELNEQKLLMDIPNEQRENMVICVNDSEGHINYAKVSERTGQEKLLQKLLNHYTGYSSRNIQRENNSAYNGYLYQEKFDNYHLGVAYLAEHKEIYSNLYELYDMVLVMLLIFLPLLLYVRYFLKKQIQEPVKHLTIASRKMEAGNIGIKVGGGEMPNAEFNYLKESFDSMSTQVKELFDYIYDEKLARRDAQILALQAQINPHFLNNTLEMMNWQARMSGDVVVSKMIESLGTVLDYRMNRANVKEIYLQEELRCTDAYFYIMSMRFGQRLKVEKEIDEELLYINVPPLILQPLVENAIVHGVENAKSGSIGVHVYHDEEQVYLKVTNTGKKLSKEEQERIQAILSGDTAKIPKGKGKHTSIGIRNVNERIKLVYGEEYGLSICQEESGITVSTIVLPYQQNENEVDNERKEEERNKRERQKVESELRNMHQNNKNT